MIKKSIDTVKRNPIILIWILMIFVAEVALSIVRTELFYQTPYPHAEDSLIGFMAVQIIITVISIAYAIFLYGPFIYLIYQAAIGKVQKGWYKTAVKRSLFRYLPLYILFILILISRANILISKMLFESSVEMAYAIFIMPYINTLLRICIMFIYYFITIPVMAEERVLIGYKNVFAVGRKYFFIFMLLYFCTYIPSSLFSGLFSVKFYDGQMLISYIMTFTALGFSTIMIAALYVIGINMYVTKRAEMIEKKECNKGRGIGMNRDQQYTYRHNSYIRLNEDIWNEINKVLELIDGKNEFCIVNKNLDSHTVNDCDSAYKLIAQYGEDVKDIIIIGQSENEQVTFIYNNQPDRKESLLKIDANFADKSSKEKAKEILDNIEHEANVFFGGIGIGFALLMNSAVEVVLNNVTLVTKSERVIAITIVGIAALVLYLLSYRGLNSIFYGKKEVQIWIGGNRKKEYIKKNRISRIKVTLFIVASLALYYVASFYS